MPVFLGFEKPQPAIVAPDAMREALRNIVDAWDAFKGMQLQLDEGLEQAVEAGRSALSAPGASK